MHKRYQLAIWGGGVLVAGAIASGIVLAFSGESRAAPTKAEYFARIAAICRTYGPQLDKIDPPHDIAIPGEVAGPVALVLPLLVAQQREVRAVRPPKELAAKVERWLVLGDRSIETLKRTLREAFLPDIRTMGPDWLLFVDQREAAGKAGDQIGFPKDCGAATA